MSEELDTNLTPDTWHHSTDIEKTLSEAVLRYSMVWEDIRLLYEGLEIVRDDDILSISSAGDNVLGLLLQEPRSIWAVDINPAQNALLELKVAGIRSLSYTDFLCLIGIKPAENRLELYARCRTDLPSYARVYWDEHGDTICAGIVGSGRLETYFRNWRTHVILPTISAQEIEACLEMDNAEAQTVFFGRYFDNPAFYDRFVRFTSRDKVAEWGRDPAQFAYVEGEIGDQLYDRFTYVFTRLPLADNFFMHFLLTREFRDRNQLPPYLQKTNFQKLKQLIDRLRIVTGSLQRVLSQSSDRAFSKGNFSDMFEYMSADETASFLEGVHRVLRPAGRIAYWSLLVDRSLPRSTDPLYRPLDEQARALGMLDRNWFYRNFHLYEVR